MSNTVSHNLGVSVARLFCSENENIDVCVIDEVILRKFDRITEKHLVLVKEGIKADIR